MSVSAATQKPTRIPSRVRYIKLGEKGKYEKRCLERGIIRFGFGTGTPSRFPLCRDGRWDELRKSFIDDGNSPTLATRFANQARFFFEDDGSTLWITFVGERLCWGLLAQSREDRQPGAEWRTDGGAVYRDVVGGWRWTDVNGEPLTKGSAIRCPNQVCALSRDLL